MIRVEINVIINTFEAELIPISFASEISFSDNSVLII